MNFASKNVLNIPVPTVVSSRVRADILSAAMGFGSRRIAMLMPIAMICTSLVAVPAISDQPASVPAADSVNELTADLAADVPIWIAELDAPKAQARREAEQRLIQAGPDAAQHVPVILDHLSIDAQQRLARIQKQWQASATRTELELTVVKLQNAKTLGDALEAISTASGVEFDTAPGGASLDLTQKIRPPSVALGFWESLDTVLDQTNLDINFYAGDHETLALIPRSEDRPSRVDSAAYSGIYRLEPTIVTARRVLGSPLQSSLNLTIVISWQPNRTPIGLTIPIAELSGKLDNEVDLKPQTSGKTIDVATTTELAMSQFYLPMQLPQRNFEAGGLNRGGAAQMSQDATEIKRISGQITALLPGERRRFELPLDTPAASDKQDAMTVSIEAVRESEPLHEIRVGVELESAGRALESHRQWIFQNEVYVELANGRRHDHLGFEVYRQTGSGVGIGYLFDLGEGGDPVGGPQNLPPGAKLIYESPTSVMKNQVPFLLNGIPLP
ncbi:hypothetical protein SAMN06265222_11263 [Neorhodopirellula lusitana]|uniref:Uncharacterized protein n=1 Tax=Neorhodopirellula lusitana TaxID=445327 RepID=A0ABY1QHS9_9BACT|nr:hypothetical protein [Neorhodopirellula lusitana]SMP69574.1 hypothetical protein SAMN06265222_11263 [Neorhodopirellula lusitana]